MSTDVRHQATWRLCADGRWEVEVHDDIIDRVPASLGNRFAYETEGEVFTLRCDPEQVAEIMSAIVLAARWYELSSSPTRYEFRAESSAQANAFHAALDDADVWCSMFVAIGSAAGHVDVSFTTDEPVAVLHALIDAVPGGQMIRETLAPLESDGWLLFEPRPPRRRDRPKPKAEA